MALPDTQKGQQNRLAGIEESYLSPADRLAYLLRDPWAALTQVLQGMGVDPFSNSPLATNMKYKAQTLPTAFILSKGPGYEWSGPESFFDFIRSYAMGRGAPVDLRAQLRQAVQAEPGSDWYNFFRDPEHFPTAYDAAEWLANAYRAATANTYSPMHASMARRIASELPTRFSSGVYGTGSIPASTTWTDWLRENRHLLPGF